ncbi:hypothetical protein OPV22_015534 [Ensete ventricosum]|uniref:Uncharacterized protein n=1 Tax=Ensete ventricosum TaxID=4639 RepID=A0AAV8RC54_ENSVE|nr:hypothetical protein OPV22_015534 [Ensete ventricosum]
MLAVVENAKAHERGPICDASDEKFETLDFAGKEGFVLISMDEATSTSPMGAVSEAKCNEVNMEKSAVSDLMEEESREESGRYMAKDPTQKWAEQEDGPKDGSRMAEAKSEARQDLVAGIVA